jgi:YesN/AraC family two-component response regulator
MIVVHFEMTSYPTQSIEYFECKDPQKLATLFQEILDCWTKKDVGYKFQCSAIFYEILAECYAQNYRQDQKQSKIQPSVDYIHQNYPNSNLTMKEIADRSFMSEVYFRKLFKNEYGISPQKYIIRLRIQNATGLISTGYYSLKEVALMSGYPDYKYFSVEFKKIIGISPSEYLYNYSDETTASSRS